MTKKRRTKEKRRKTTQREGGGGKIEEIFASKFSSNRKGGPLGPRGPTEGGTKEKRSQFW